MKNQKPKLEIERKKYQLKLDGKVETVYYVVLCVLSCVARYTYMA